MASSRPSHSPPPSRPGPAPAPSLASILLVALRPSYSDAATDAALCSSVVTDLEPFEARDADGAGLAHGLLLLAYPLPPPGRPERRRTEHLTTLRTPTVFVHGTRDPFGFVDELEEARGLVPAPTRLLSVRDAGHDLGVRGNGSFAQAAVAELLALLG